MVHRYTAPRSRPSQRVPPRRTSPPTHAADYVTAQANLAWAGTQPTPSNVCHALSRPLARALEFTYFCAHVSPVTPSIPPPLNLNSDGSPQTYRTAIAGPSSDLWRVEEGVEISKLIDTCTMHPIQPSAQPVDRRKDTTYYNAQVKEKAGTNDTVKRHFRGTIGGDRINYPFNVSARTADMDVVKILLNSVISTNANWLTLDIVDYYLGTPLPRPARASLRGML